MVNLISPGISEKYVSRRPIFKLKFAVYGASLSLCAEVVYLWNNTLEKIWVTSWTKTRMAEYLENDWRIKMMIDISRKPFWEDYRIHIHRSFSVLGSQRPLLSPREYLSIQRTKLSWQTSRKQTRMMRLSLKRI